MVPKSKDGSVIRDNEQTDVFLKKFRALTSDRTAGGEDYVRLVAEAEQLGRERERDLLLDSIQYSFPRYLDRAVPNRAREAEQAMRALIRSLSQRFSLNKNVLPNVPVRGSEMTTPVARGVVGEITLTKYIEVLFVYGNPEGYRASISIEQASPIFPVESVVSYWRQKTTDHPLTTTEGLERNESGLLAFSVGQTSLFEHLLGRVIAGQELDTVTEKGHVYRTISGT